MNDNSYLLLPIHPSLLLRVSQVILMLASLGTKCLAYPRSRRLER